MKYSSLLLQFREPHMNDKVLKKLEFDKVTDMLTSFAAGREAKELCRNTVPVKHLSLLERLHQENEDAMNRIFKKGAPSFGSIKDIRRSILSTKQEFTLSMRDFLDVASTLVGFASLSSYGDDETGDDETGDQ